jgi:hypothetical protein
MTDKRRITITLPIADIDALRDLDSTSNSRAIRQLITTYRADLKTLELMDAIEQVKELAARLAAARQQDAHP